MRKFIGRLFSPQLDLRVRLFHILSLAGIGLSLYATVVMGRHGDIDILRGSLALGGAVLTALLLWYAMRTGKYERCYAVAVALVFFGLFSFLLFSGGVDGSLVYLPVLGVLFTAMLLRGWKGLLTTAAEVLYYAVLFVLIIMRQELHPGFYSVRTRARDMGLGFFVMCGALALCVFSMMRLYDKQKERLEEQNRMKTQFLQDIRHEIRNPLQVISLGTDYVHSRIDMEGGAEEARNALLVIQNEALRMGRMINGMVELAVMSDRAMQREKVDFAAMLHKCAEASRLQLEQKQI